MHALAPLVLQQVVATPLHYWRESLTSPTNLAAFLPVDEEGLLVNQVVRFVEERTEITRVAQVCEHFGLSERTLQRLTQRRLGLSPKWVIQRRRLHEAADRLRSGTGNLATVAAELGYADQAHLTHDFRSVTGLTPGEFAARYATHRPGEVEPG